VELDPGEQPIREGSILDFWYILLEGWNSRGNICSYKGSNWNLQTWGTGCARLVFTYTLRQAVHSHVDNFYA